MTKGEVRVRLLFADEGSFHDEEISIPGRILGKYERLIDCLQEDPDVLKMVHVDLGRLVHARRLDSE
jgi:hypothetical protein